MQGNNAIRPMKELINELKEVANTEYDNNELLKILSVTFSQKGLSQRNIACIFEDTKLPEELSEMELMAFTEGCYNTFKKQGKDWARKFELTKYFGNNKLIEYDTFMNEENEIAEINLTNFIEMDDYNYRGNISYKQVYDYLENMLLIYNKTTQRASKLKKIGTKDLWVREISVNAKAVKEISEAILAGIFEDSEIILNCRIIKKKISKFEYKEKVKGIGDITIIPDYDRSSENYTVCEILDGYHRIRGN